MGPPRSLKQSGGRSRETAVVRSFLFVPIAAYRAAISTAGTSILRWRFRRKDLDAFFENAPRDWDFGGYDRDGE